MRYKWSLFQFPIKAQSWTWWASSWTQRSWPRLWGTSTRTGNSENILEKKVLKKFDFSTGRASLSLTSSSLWVPGQVCPFQHSVGHRLSKYPEIHLFCFPQYILPLCFPFRFLIDEDEDTFKLELKEAFRMYDKVPGHSHIKATEYIWRLVKHNNSHKADSLTYRSQRSLS